MKRIEDIKETASQNGEDTVNQSFCKMTIAIPKPTVDNMFTKL